MSSPPSSTGREETHPRARFSGHTDDHIRLAGKSALLLPSCLVNARSGTSKCRCDWTANAGRCTPSDNRWVRIEVEPRQTDSHLCVREAPEPTTSVKSQVVTIVAVPALRAGTNDHRPTRPIEVDRFNSRPEEGAAASIERARERCSRTDANSPILPRRHPAGVLRLYAPPADTQPMIRSRQKARES